ARHDRPHPGHDLRRARPYPVPLQRSDPSTRGSHHHWHAGRRRQACAGRQTERAHRARRRDDACCRGGKIRTVPLFRKIGTVPIFLLLALAAWAQGTPVIGYLGAETPEIFASRLAAFRDALAEMNYTEGRTVVIESGWARG